MDAERKAAALEGVLVQRSQGSPLFAQELARQMLESGAAVADRRAGCVFVPGATPIPLVKAQDAPRCMTCGKPFTKVPRLRRRHHCRRCCALFCDGCSAPQGRVLDKGYRFPVRLCADPKWLIALLRYVSKSLMSALSPSPVLIVAIRSQPP